MNRRWQTLASIFVLAVAAAPGAQATASPASDDSVCLVEAYLPQCLGTPWDPPSSLSDPLSNPPCALQASAPGCVGPVAPPAVPTPPPTIGMPGTIPGMPGSM
jgi:hypothetical protein